MFQLGRMSPVSSGAASIESAGVRSTSETLSSTMRPARWRSSVPLIRAAAVALVKLGHVEAVALIHHRQNFAPQVDDAFFVPGRLRTCGDLIRYSAPPRPRLRWAVPEFVIAEAKDQEFAFLARFAVLFCGGAARCPRTESLHDVLPKELLRRQD